MTQTRFKQIEEALRQQIIANDLAPGVKLPSEAELVEQYGASRITIRQALAGLHSSGLIEKINGKGSFVTRPSERSDLGQLTGFYEAARKRGQTANGELLSVRPIPAPPFAVQALGLDEGATLVCATTLRLWNAAPVAVFMVMGEKPLMDALVAEDLETNDAMSILEERLGYRLKHLETESAAIAATKEHARRLKVEPGTPLLRVRCTPFDIQGNALCCAELLFRGDRFAYKAKVSR
ncbi:GntR family transcriptional regulator [Caballeronia glebae]|jgi:GntR family transcriptional regulator|uniref:GntR family transcriptional regulator n=1 Tax=Caballeronia glebae TaxID=1777143 RepID=A0A158C331_9BURK|nr:GntR family transcriptional regulator [Caballeronia glebae]SAK76775.1 GntR family transcriptional regulator [Caballeronia glebae]